MPLHGRAFAVPGPGGALNKPRASFLALNVFGPGRLDQKKEYMYWQEKIQEELLYPEALLQLLPYMTKALAEDKKSADCKHDPITGTLVVLLTCPIQLGLTEVGAMLFQGHSSLIYPYSLMCPDQRDFVRRCLDDRQDWRIYNGAVVFRQPARAPPLVLAPSAVLLAFCEKLLNSAQHAGQDRQLGLSPEQRLAVCNIVLQRVQGYVQIDKPVHRELNEWLASNARRQREAEQGGTAPRSV